jgi:hypothetical protein
VKLGIVPGSRVLVLDRPDAVDLAPLPPDVTVHSRATGAPYDVVLVFCPDRATLERRFAPLVARITTPGALWVAWPKKASGLAKDLDENVVREVGLATGLVDVKVIAIDAVWSGLKFVRRVTDR